MQLCSKALRSVQTEKSTDKSAIKRPAWSCLTQLVQEASGLQVLSHKFAILSLTACVLTCDNVANRLQVRQALHDILASWSRLRNSEASFLLGCDPALVQIITGAFSCENERIFDCFEAMARNICTSLSQGNAPNSDDLTELVRFVSHELSDANKSIASAAQLVADTGRTEDEKLVLTDLLTGLPNRRALQDLLRHNETTGWLQDEVAIMHIDLDNFKKINDAFGHAAGDVALQHAANAMALHTRDDDFLARVGGDEFVLVLFSPVTEQALAQRARMLIESISAPFLYERKRCSIGGSIGIAVGSRSDGIALDRHMINADLALYNAKHGGRGTYRFFTPFLRTQYEQKEDLHAQIRDGLDTQQFEPFFQPQVEGRSGKLVGLESLARWHHPTRGTLVPFHFLDAAHDAGVLEQLDQYLMERTFASLRSWLNNSIPIPQVSINMTGSRLLEVDLVETMVLAVGKADLDTSMIAIEILESAMIDDNSRQMIDNIAGLAEAGFKLELDDFGTGHASISSLRNFKVNRIKIDRSFVKDVHLYPELSKITGAMIGLAHSLRVDALAEGVETAEERLVLNALGCDHFQGYGVSRPMPGSEIPDWVMRTQNTKALPPRRK